MAVKADRRPTRASSFPSLDLEESVALGRMVGHLFTELADGLLGVREVPFDRRDSLALLDLAGYAENEFWAMWQDAQ